MIQKIMEIEDARRIYDEISTKLEVVDLDEICPIDSEKEPNSDEHKFIKEMENKIIQGITCGLVYWDEEHSCIAQRLTKPVKNGNNAVEILYYKRPMTLNMQHLIAEQNKAGIVAKMTDHSVAVIGTIEAFDSAMATFIIKSFFDV